MILTSVNASSCDSAEDRLNCLREVKVDHLDKAVSEIAAKRLYASIPIQPVVDGTFIAERPQKAVELRQFNTVRFPVLVLDPF